MLAVAQALVLTTATLRVELVPFKRVMAAADHKMEIEMVESTLVVAVVLLQTLLTAVKLEMVMVVLVLLLLDIQQFSILLLVLDYLALHKLKDYKKQQL
jgi:hypothetical protein